MKPTNLRRRGARERLKRASLPAMTFHQLRYTVVTILPLKNVTSIIVSEMLRYATIAIMLGTYSHVLPNMQHTAVAAMEEAFS
jgi:integrase